MTAPAAPQRAGAAIDLDHQLREIVESIRVFMDAERCTLFQYDESRQELWSKIFSGPRIEEIRVALGEGIAGFVMKTGEWVRIDDAAQDPRFQARFDRQSGFVTRSVLCVPLVNVQGTRIGVVQVINKRSGSFSERDAELLAALNAQAAIAIENGHLYERLRVARAKEVSLARQLQLKHGELQDAFRRLEETNSELRSAVEVAHRLRLAAGAGALLLFAVLIGLSWRRAGPETNRPGARGGARVVEVAPAALEVVVPMVGKLEPLDLATVVSPLTGAVRRLAFRYGESVEAGRALLELDTSQVEVEERTARAAVIRAAQRVRELEQWDSSSEVSDARRNLSRADLELQAARRSFAEVGALFEKGIVRREENEAARDGLAKSELDHRSVEEQLTSVIEKGSAENRQIAAMELENARVQFEKVESRRQQAAVIAPASGVVLLPGSRGVGGAALEEGARVEQGQPLLAVGNLATLGVVCSADEVDVARVRLGQAARVRTEAFAGRTLAGAVRSVSAQATAARAGGATGFEVVVALEDVPAEALSGFRLGLSATAEVVVYARPDALMVPIEAVRNDERGDWVEVVGGDGRTARREVRLGETTVDAVEVVSGLAAGDRVAVPVG